MSTRTVLAVAGVAVAGGCAQSHEPDRQVKHSDYGRAWPFTVDEGMVGCRRGGGGVVLTFTSDGTSYALNDPARAAGHRPPAEILDTDSHNGQPKSLQLLIEAAAEQC